MTLRILNVRPVRAVGNPATLCAVCSPWGGFSTNRRDPGFEIFRVPSLQTGTRMFRTGRAAPIRSGDTPMSTKGA